MVTIGVYGGDLHYRQAASRADYVSNFIFLPHDDRTRQTIRS